MHLGAIDGSPSYRQLMSRLSVTLEAAISHSNCPNYSSALLHAHAPSAMSGSHSFSTSPFPVHTRLFCFTLSSPISSAEEQMRKCEERCDAEQHTQSPSVRQHCDVSKTRSRSGTHNSNTPVTILPSIALPAPAVRKLPYFKSDAMPANPPSQNIAVTDSATSMATGCARVGKYRSAMIV
jgi:hypothetical protein